VGWATSVAGIGHATAVTRNAPRFYGSRRQ
jgi:hypothetical protein